MKAIRIVLCAVLAWAMAAFAGNEPDTRLAKAKELFDRYIRLESAFDGAIADLYSDDAVIKNKRTYPTGQVKELVIPATKYKELILAVMPLAKARSDTNEYSEMKYTIEGDGVRITAERYSNLKKYHSSLSLLVKPTASGAWLIYEELSESQP